MCYEMRGQEPEGRGKIRSKVSRAEHPDDAIRANVGLMMGREARGIRKHTML